VAEAKLSAIWCHPSLSQPVRKGQNIFIKTDCNYGSKSCISSFTNLQTLLYVLVKPSPLKVLLTAWLTDPQAAATCERVQSVVLNAACRDELRYLLVDMSGAPLFLPRSQYRLNESVIQTRRNTRLVLLLAQVVPWCVRHHLTRNIQVAESSHYTLCFMLNAVKIITIKAKSNSITGLDRPWGFQEVEDPKFQDNRHMEVVSLSALRTGRLYQLGNILGTHFC